MTFDAWGRPLHCCECGGWIFPHEAAGRPRFTCGDACAAERHNRVRREEREYMRQPALVDSKAARIALEEFQAWARGNQ